MSGLDVTALLAAYDAQLRANPPDKLPEGARAERDGPLVRYIGFPHGGFVDYRDLGEIRDDQVDALIARQVQVFAARGDPFEWKLHEHDRPADLAERLVASGLIPEARETVMIAPVATVATDPMLSGGVTLLEVTERNDLDRIAEMERAVWHEDRSWLAESLEAERRVDPDALTIVVAEATGTVVCAAWVRFVGGTEFATLWGGATLEEWRGRGIYRAIVAYRANLAAARGFRYLQVDASDDSRPILSRLGFVAVTTTTPYVWSPPSS